MHQDDFEAWAKAIATVYKFYKSGANKKQIDAHLGMAQGKKDLDDTPFVGFRLGIPMKRDCWCACLWIVENFDVPQRRCSTLRFDPKRFEDSFLPGPTSGKG